MMTEKPKAIFIGRSNKVLARSLLELFGKENIRFVSSKTTLQEVLEEVSKKDISNDEIDFYFQVGKSGYGYSLSISQCPMNERFFQIYPKFLSYNTRRS